MKFFYLIIGIYCGITMYHIVATAYNKSNVQIQNENVIEDEVSFCHRVKCDLGLTTKNHSVYDECECVGMFL